MDNKNNRGGHMFQFNIIQGKTREPFKGIIYGDNGVGKSTFASYADNVLILDLEGNVSHLDAPRQPIKSYEEFEACLQALLETEHGCKNLVVDSLDRLETFAKDYVERAYKGNSKSLEYGGKANKTLNLFPYLIELMDRLRDKKGMNIILLCHDMMRTQQELDMPTYSRRELSLDPKISAQFQNWSNFIFYAEKEKVFTTVESDNPYKRTNKKTLRTSIDNRILRTNGHPGLLAKNTWNLPDIIELKPTKEGWSFLMECIDAFYNTQSTEA
jgi:hypothetical protein